MRAHVRRNLHSRRGNATYTALTILVLMGFGALAVDIGHLRMVKAQLEVAVDASALAAVGTLDPADDRTYDDAVNAAIVIAEQQMVDGREFGLTNSQVEVGVWDPDDQSFTVSADEDQVNAVRVTANRADISTIFGLAAFGVESFDAHAISVAMVERPGGVVTEGDCYLPIAVASCWFTEASPDIMEIDFVFSDANHDNAAWAAANGEIASNSAPNSFVVRALDDYNDGDESCIGGTAAVGNDVNLNNGLQNNAVRAMDDAIERATTAWDESHWGLRPAPTEDSIVDDDAYGRHAGMTAEQLAEAAVGVALEGPILIFDAGADYTCPAPDSGQLPLGDYNGNEQIVGFAWGVVYDVAGNGGGGAPDMQVHLRVDTSTATHLWGDDSDPIEGAIDAGVLTPKSEPRVVF